MTHTKHWSIALTLCISLCLCSCGSQGSQADIRPVKPDPPAVSDPAPTSALPETTPPQPENSESAADTVEAAVQMLDLKKQLDGLYDWEDADLLVQSEFSHVTLWHDGAAKYPELAQTLDQTAAMVTRSMEDEYDNLCVSVREDLPWAEEYTETWVSTLDIQVRRADSVVLSLLSDSRSDYGLIEDYRGMHGTNYDTQTGQVLALDDVVKDINQNLAEAVIKELNSHMWAGNFDYRAAVEGYFANTPHDGISWTLDYNGVTFYFADGELTEPGNGRQTATVSFAEYPQLFEEKYTAVPESYMVELPMDSSFFTDLDNNGDLEELNVTGWYSTDVGSYAKFGIYSDSSGSFHYEECFADGFHPYYVKTADGNHFLYLFCEQNEGSGPVPMMLLIVFDVSGGRVDRVGEMNAAPGFIPPNIYRVPTDPNCIWLDDFDSMAQDMTAHSVGSTGLPEPTP